MAHPLDSLLALHASPRLARATEGLAQVLERPAEEPSVYFLVPLANLTAIADAGLILPRSQVRKIPKDCSSQGMQSRRGAVFLGKGDDGKPQPPVDVHDCNNFFWNPVNATLDAYCRNSLLLGGKQIEIVVLEIPLAGLRRHLPAEGLHWAASQGNVASRREGAWHSSTPHELGRPSWPWEEIFGTTEQDRAHPARKAELLLQVSRAARGVPLVAVSRCLAPSEEVAVAARRLLGRSSHVSACFKPKSVLLRSDQRVADFFAHNLPLGFSLQAQLDNYEAILDRHQLRLSSENFLSSRIGSNFVHGTPHVARVMFWSHHLAARYQGEIAPLFSRESFIADCLWAALIHDLCRENEGEDSEHGRKAAMQFQPETRRRCDGDESRIRLIQEAVEFHCQDDSEYTDPSNPVYRVLKDADALDRGRFGPPCAAGKTDGRGCMEERCGHQGCAYRTLRLGTPGAERSRRELAWAAYYLAIGTKFAPWPARDGQSQLVAFIRHGVAAMGN